MAHQKVKNVGTLKFLSQINVNIQAFLKFLLKVVRRFKLFRKRTSTPGQCSLFQSTTDKSNSQKYKEKCETTNNKKKKKGSIQNMMRVWNKNLWINPWSMLSLIIYKGNSQKFRYKYGSNKPTKRHRKSSWNYYTKKLYSNIEY